MKIFEIKKYGVFGADIINGADDQVINMDGLTHSYDTVFQNRGTSGITIALKLHERAGYDSEFGLIAGETLALNDWDIVGIRVSNKSGTDSYLQIIMGGE